jgi:hypothetical protein
MKAGNGCTDIFNDDIAITVIQMLLKKTRSWIVMGGILV